MKLPAFFGRALGVLMALAVCLPLARGADSGLRTGRVAWGRLVTAYSSWNVHAQNDPTLAQFVRDSTTLNIDPTYLR